MNGGKPIDVKIVDGVPDFRDLDAYGAEFERLKKLCSSILQEEKKAVEAAAVEAAAADTATAETAAAEKQDAKEKAQALKNYVIIRSVAVAEGILKSMTASLIDTFEISMKSMSETNSWKGDLVQIHLDEMPEIKNSTVGQIITSQKKLANARTLGDTFQAINGIYETPNARKKRNNMSGKMVSHPFFDWLQELSRTEKSVQNLYIEIDEMIQRRNETTHEPHDIDDSVGDIKKQITNLQGLTIMIWFASWFNLSRHHPDYNEKWEKKDAIQCSINFVGLKLDEFFRITAKHTKN